MDTRKTLARGAAAVFQVMLVLWTGAKLMADWIGRSTLVEDAGHATGLLEKGAEWLFLTPWWVPAALATALTALIIFYNLPGEGRRSATRHDSLSPDGESAVARRSDATDASPPTKTPEEQQAYDVLTVFFTDCILHAGRAQLDLQKAIIKEICNDDELDWLASQALLTNYRVKQFGTPFERLWGAFGSSPMTRVPLDELMTSILAMDKGYQVFCDQSEQLAKSAGFGPRTHICLAPLWNDWRCKHNKLVKAYRAIKRDRRFPMLFRPGIEGPWDREIPPPETGNA